VGRWFQVRVLRLFGSLSRTSLWFETRFSDAGRYVIGGAIGAAIFGLDPRQTTAFSLAAIFIGIIAVAVLGGVRWRPKIEIERLLPDTVTVGIAATYTIAITNNGSSTEVGLVFEDRLLTRYPTVESFRGRGSDEHAGTNWFDRRVGFPRWLNLLRKGRGARLETTVLPPLPPGETHTITRSLVPLRRGKIVFTTVLFKRPDPLGVFFALYKIPLYGELIALPERYPIPSFKWNSHRHFHLGGLTLATTVGDSEEFIGLREYRPGDPLRHMHWRSFAKTRTPVIKEYQDEYFDRHALVLDTFRGDAAPSEFETAIAVAASFIQSTRPRDSILDLVFIEQEIWRLSAGRGISNNRQILIQLAEVEAAPVDGFEHLAAYIERYGDQLASLLLVGTTWDPVRAAFIQRLQNRGIRCVALKVNSHEMPLPSAGAGTVPRAPHVIRPGSVARDIAQFAFGDIT